MAIIVSAHQDAERVDLAVVVGEVVGEHQAAAGRERGERTLDERGRARRCPRCGTRGRARRGRSRRARTSSSRKSPGRSSHPIGDAELGHLRRATSMTPGRSLTTAVVSGIGLEQRDRPRRAAGAEVEHPWRARSAGEADHARREHRGAPLRRERRRARAARRTPPDRPRSVSPAARCGWCRRGATSWRAVPARHQPARPSTRRRRSRGTARRSR